LGADNAFDAQRARTAMHGGKYIRFPSAATSPPSTAT
jgi:hypothetical protein